MNLFFKSLTFLYFQIGVTNPGDQQKVLNALQQMNLDKVDLRTIEEFGGADTG